MDKLHRNERMSAMLKMLTDSPNRIITLSHFCELFGAAKSTMSEDIDLLREVTKTFGLGELETVTGAAGGVRYRAAMSPEERLRCIQGVCETLSGPERVLPGGFLYYNDILSDPELATRMGRILATAYFDVEADFVLTMETKGIPVALMTARELGIPLVIARHALRAYEGSAVNINYVSGSSGSIQTMSLARRSVKEGTRALIIDDFLKGGGTARGMVDLMREFNVTVVGMAFVMETTSPERKRVSDHRALMTLDITGTGEDAVATVRPAAWLAGAAK